jgi:hypothetical protein
MRRAVLPGLLIAVSLIVLFSPALVGHFRTSIDPFVLNDDARQQIWPFLRYRDPALFQEDYLADYQIAQYPLGYYALYRFSAPLIDPRLLSKLVPYLTLGVLLASVAAAAWRLAGPAAAWGSLILCLSADTYLAEMAGGLPRAFGHPVVALTGAALVAGRPALLAATACLGMALYYPVGLLGGAALAILLALPPGWTGLGEKWTRRRRLGTVLVAAALSLAIALPSLLALRPFGPPLGPADVVEYPEAGESGRLQGHDVVQRLPLWDIAPTVWRWSSAAVTAPDEPWSWRIREFGRALEPLLVFAFLATLVAGTMRRRRGSKPGDF